MWSTGLETSDVVEGGEIDDSHAGIIDDGQGEDKDWEKSGIPVSQRAIVVQV